MVMEPTVHVVVDGLHLYGREAHRGYLEAVARHERESHMAELFERAVEPGAVVIDVGAFVGYFALVGARVAGRGGRVVAFEPDPRDHPWLVHNIEANGFADRIEAVPLAVSDRPGTVVLYLAEEDRTQSSLYPTRDEGPPTEVRAITLDGFLGDLPPDVVKIDVEGAELRALDGMRRSIERGRPTLFVEWNPRTLLQAASRPEDLPRLLEELGYVVELIDEDRSRLIEPIFPQDKTYVNLRCTAMPHRSARKARRAKTRRAGRDSNPQPSDP